MGNRSRVCSEISEADALHDNVCFAVGLPETHAKDLAAVTPPAWGRRLDREHGDVRADERRQLVLDGLRYQASVYSPTLPWEHDRGVTVERSGQAGIERLQEKDDRFRREAGRL